MKKEHPYLPDRLRDPHLPVIHAGHGSPMQQRRSEAPLPQPDAPRDSL